VRASIVFVVASLSLGCNALTGIDDFMPSPPGENDALVSEDTGQKTDGGGADSDSTAIDSTVVDSSDLDSTLDDTRVEDTTVVDTGAPSDTTVVDTGTPTDTSITDTGTATDTTVDDSGLVSNKGFVRCGSTMCSLASGGKCCNELGSLVCRTGTESCKTGSDTLLCDEKLDCPSSNVCCADSALTGSFCTGACSGKQLCMTTPECAGAKICTATLVAGMTLGVCK